MTHLTEFPDITDITDLPALPAFLEDVSWHNDECPSFAFTAADGRELRLWTMTPQAAKFSTRAVECYSISTEDGSEEIFDSFDLDATLAMVEVLRCSDS